MNFTLIFSIIISALIVFKLKEISTRNNLNVAENKRLIIVSGLIILFFVTNITLPYPQSLYWFILFGVLLVSSILSIDILKKEFLRFKTLKPKEIVVNILFYSLFFTSIHLYI